MTLTLHDTPICALVGRTTIALIDCHEVVRKGLSVELRRVGEACAVSTDWRSLGEFVNSGARADVVVWDGDLRDPAALADIGRLAGRGCRVLLYTDEHRPVPLRAAVRAGVAGVLSKDDPLSAVTTAILVTEGFVSSGPRMAALLTDPTLVTPLSGQQCEVLRCIGEGLDLRAVARVLDVGMGTIKEHLARVRAKYRAKGVHAGNSHHLVRLARDEGHF